MFVAFVVCLVLIAVCFDCRSLLFIVCFAYCLGSFFAFCAELFFCDFVVMGLVYLVYLFVSLLVFRCLLMFSLRLCFVMCIVNYLVACLLFVC